MSLRVAIVDDEEDLRAGIARYLVRHGVDATALAGGAALDAHLAGPGADIVVLDIHMPGEDGLSIARRLRAAGSIGIVMLTSAGDSVDRIVGLEIGADDYVTKPFDPRELLARLRSLARRIEARTPPAAPPAAPAPAPAARRVGKCLLHADGSLSGPNGAPVPLTAMEADLLRVFAAHPGEVLSRERLLELAHRDPLDPFDRSIDSRVSRLRRKIEQDPARPTAIRTVHGQGYVFAG